MRVRRKVQSAAYLFPNLWLLNYFTKPVWEERSKQVAFFAGRGYTLCMRVRRKVRDAPLIFFQTLAFNSAYINTSHDMLLEYGKYKERRYAWKYKCHKICIHLYRRIRFHSVNFKRHNRILIQYKQRSKEVRPRSAQSSNRLENHNRHRKRKHNLKEYAVIGTAVDFSCLHIWGWKSVKRIGTSQASMMFFILLQDSFFINYSLLKNFIPAVLPMAATALYLYFIIYERNNQQTKICFLGV